MEANDRVTGGQTHEITLLLHIIFRVNTRFVSMCGCELHLPVGANLVFTRSRDEGRRIRRRAGEIKLKYDII